MWHVPPSAVWATPIDELVEWFKQAVRIQRAIKKAQEKKPPED